MPEYETIDFESTTTTFEPLWDDRDKESKLLANGERSQTTSNPRMERLSVSNQADVESSVKTGLGH